jgi:putative aminopeptidase FrvX
MDIAAVLKTMCLAPAPSGYEKESAYAFRDLIRPYVDELRIDRNGNVIATSFGTDSDAPSVMVFAHLDTLGFIVRRVEPDGFIQVDRLGGIPEKVLPALRLVVRNADGVFLPAVFGNKAHHAMSAEEKYKVDPVTSLFLDMGFESRTEAEDNGVNVGCPVIYEPSFSLLGQDKVCATAIDNRGGLTALIVAAEAMHNSTHKCTVHFVGTVWEEFNIRGAVFAARALKPDIAICLDVVLAGDTHDLRDRYENCLGGGPTVNYYSFHGRGTLNGTLAHEGLSKLAHIAANEDSIPVQRFASLGILTDSAYVQMEGKGIACLDLGFPARYTHTPTEVCSLSDIKNLGSLVAAMAYRIDKSFNLSRY